MAKGPIFVAVAYNFHDSSVAVSRGADILAVVEAERVFRAKKVPCTPRQMDILITSVLTALGICPDDVERWSIGSLNNPYSAEAPRDTTAPARLPILGESRDCVLYNHHYAHAGMFLLSPFRSALISTCDGGGDYGQRVAFFQGHDLDVTPLAWDTGLCTSTKPYGQSASYLFGRPFAEGSLMALAGLGEPTTEHQAMSTLYDALRDTKFADGQALLRHAFPQLQGTGVSNPKAAADYCATLQSLFEERRLADLRSALTQSGNTAVVIAGGSGLNLATNTRIYQALTPDLFVPPCCDDTGIALGQCALMIAEHLKARPRIALPYCGLCDQERWDSYAHASSATASMTPDAVARELVAGTLVLLHIGRPELGPRALGHRSFLASATSPDIHRRLSIGIKERAWYRPLAPAMLEEDVTTLFVGPARSPFMLFSYTARPGTKDRVPAAVHVDGTARVQTVARQDEPFLYAVLQHFKELSGTGLLLNTSLNLRGEPMANDLHDTLRIARRIHEPHIVVARAQDE